MYKKTQVQALPKKMKGFVKIKRDQDNFLWIRWGQMKSRMFGMDLTRTFAMAAQC